MIIEQIWAELLWSHGPEMSKPVDFLRLKEKQVLQAFTTSLRETAFESRFPSPATPPGARKRALGIIPRVPRQAESGGRVFVRPELRAGRAWRESNPRSRVIHSTSLSRRDWARHSADRGCRLIYKAIARGIHDDSQGADPRGQDNCVALLPPRWKARVRS